MDVDVAYGGGNATGGGTDYDSATDQVSFAPGSTVSQQVTVAITNDNTVEQTETFTASLSTGAALGTRTVVLTDTGTGTITDNDAATFTIDDATVNEDAGTMTLTVSLDNPIDIGFDVVVAYGGGNATGGGVDYDSNVDTASFPPNDNTAQTVDVAITDDNIVEITETFSIGLAAGTALGGRSADFSDTAIGTITDSGDTAAFTVSDVTVDEAEHQAQAEGHEVTTIEGIGAPDDLHPMQAAFQENHGLQCGFCTPGMVMSAIDMVNRHDTLDEKTVRHQLEGNICRCTGYHNIVKAILAAHPVMKGQQ